MKAILDILNKGGVHLPTCEEWMKIAKIQHRKNKFNPITPFQLMQRFEELVRGKLDGDPIREWEPALLKKEMFVCGVEKPKMKEGYSGRSEDIYESDLWQYQSAQEKVWFEGFEVNGHQILFGNTAMVLNHKYDVLTITSNAINEYNAVDHPTVFDLIIELDRYNRTAKEKIEINWTENFVKLSVNTT